MLRFLAAFVRRFAAFVLVWSVIGGGAARADDDPRASAEATYADAAKADEDLRFADALAGYERSLAILPSHRFAQRAQTRIDFLRGHAEGGFAPLVTLETVRRTPGATKDPTKVDTLFAAAQTFPRGAVRAEADFVAGEAYLTELSRPDDAERAFRAVLDEHSASPLLEQQAAARLVERALERRDLDDATALAARAADPTLTRKVVVAKRRSKLHLLALVALGGFTGAATLTILRRRRGLAAARSFVPWALALALWIGAGGGFLASQYESGNATPFLVFGALLLPLVLLARLWATAASQNAALRAGRAALSFAAVLGAAFLLLERIDPRYLDGFGL